MLIVRKGIFVIVCKQVSPPSLILKQWKDAHAAIYPLSEGNGTYAASYRILIAIEDTYATV
jgi:hypothetical protein